MRNIVEQVGGLFVVVVDAAGDAVVQEAVVETDVGGSGLFPPAGGIETRGPVALVIIISELIGRIRVAQGIIGQVVIVPDAVLLPGQAIAKAQL